MKFYHIADVHLGAVPDRGRPYSEQRRQDIWDTFRDMITWQSGNSRIVCLCAAICSTGSH